jgi:hypothetical protein
MAALVAAIHATKRGTCDDISRTWLLCAKHFAMSRRGQPWDKPGHDG